jgi:Fusaric acid resistance protein-like
MQALNAHERNLAALARSVRTAIVVSSLFAVALLVIKQPAVAGFAVFGTFAHQALVNYDPQGTTRFAQSAMLTLLGVITVGLGTLASGSAWLAVSVTIVAGIMSELPELTISRVSAIRQALLLSFLCAVAVPAPALSVFPHLAGWLMAGVVAQPALLLVWTSPQRGNAAEGGWTSCAAASTSATAQSSWIAKALRSGFALGLAVLLTRLMKVEHAFWVVLGVLPVLNSSGGVARTFWQEQSATLAGFLMSALVVAVIGEHQAWYWLILPLVAFGSTYAASALGFMAGQAAFTVFAVVLFCILLPHQERSGLLRLEDIALGGAVSLAAGALIRLGERRSLDRPHSAVKV